MPPWPRFAEGWCQAGAMTHVDNLVISKGHPVICSGVTILKVDVTAHCMVMCSLHVPGDAVCDGTDRQTTHDRRLAASRA